MTVLVESMSDKLQMALHFVKECVPILLGKGGKKKNQDFKNSKQMLKNFSPLGGTGFEPHSPSTGIYFMLQVDPFFAFGLICF